MADVRAFRGIHYNQEAIGDLSLVVAPPYDIIDDAGRDALYNKHPYNVIRLILNRAKKSDPTPDAPYERAGEFLERWTAQRILVRDPVPSVYLYRQRYLLDGDLRECTGVVARVRVEDFAKGGILPHEEILPKPLADRLKLLTRTRTNLDLVHLLYSDPAERLKKPILAETDRFPMAQFQTDDGMAHDVWAVSDPRFVDRVTAFFKGKPLYIADGHHRYQTALEFVRRLEEEGEALEEDDPRRFLMVMIVEMENPGLSLLPVHRVVRAGGDVPPGELAAGLARWFEVEELEVPAGPRSGQVFHLIKAVGAAGAGGPAFGAFTRHPERFLLLRWRTGLDVLSEVGGEASEAYRRLDVTVLQKVVVERNLGIAPDRESVERNLAFTRDPLEAVRRVDSGEALIAFFTNPIKVEQVKEVADSGEKMPQKSTYFHPKPSSGVVMNRITDW